MTHPDGFARQLRGVGNPVFGWSWLFTFPVTFAAGPVVLGVLQEGGAGFGVGLMAAILAVMTFIVLVELLILPRWLPVPLRRDRWITRAHLGLTMLRAAASAPRRPERQGPEKPWKLNVMARVDFFLVCIALPVAAALYGLGFTGAVAGIATATGALALLVRVWQLQHGAVQWDWFCELYREGIAFSRSIAPGKPESHHRKTSAMRIALRGPVPTRPDPHFLNPFGEAGAAPDPAQAEPQRPETSH